MNIKNQINNINLDTIRFFRALLHFSMTNAGHALVVVLVIVFSVLGYLLYVTKAQAAVGINKEVNFQGKLVNSDGTNVADNTYSVVFSLYNVSSGGSAIWTETDNVTTSNGIFQVELGANTLLPGTVDFNSDSLYLGIKVGTDAEMTPRIRFTAVPYAFNSAALDGVVATQSATGFNLQGGTSTQSTLAVTTGGSGLTFTPGVAEGLTIESNGANGLTLDTGGNGAVDIGTTNATSLVLGSSNVSSITFETAGTGDSSVVLPDQSIGASEIVDNSLDFDKFAAVQTLDQDHTVDFGGYNYLYNLNSSGDFLIQDTGNTFADFAHDGTITLGKSASADTINIGTGTGADTVNIGTNDTVGDSLTLGNDNASTSLSLTSGGTLSITGNSLSLTGDSSWSVNSAGTASFANLSGAGLSNCNSSTDKLLWSSTGQFSCGSDNNTAAVFDVYDNTGGQTVTTSPIVVNLNTIRKDDSNFTLSSNVVTVNADGTYEITLAGGAAYDSTVRSDATFSLALNTGSGFSSVADSQCIMYTRQTTNAGTCSRTVVLDLVSGDQVELSAVSSGNGTTIAGASSLTLDRVVGGSSGGGGISGIGVRTTDGLDTVSDATTIEFGQDPNSNDQFYITDAGGGIAQVTLGDQVALLDDAATVTGGWTFDTTTTAFTTELDANGGISTSSTNQNLTLAANGSGNILLAADSNTSVGVGTTTPLATLDVRGQLGTSPAASISAQTANASLVIDNSGTGDILTASKSGATKFTITNNGQIVGANYTTAGGILFADGTGTFMQTTAGLDGQCLQSTQGSTPTWGTCGGSGSSQWGVANGAISPNFASTVDLLLGSTATASAKFAFVNVNSGTPTASISATSGNALSLDANGDITTTQGQTLTLGGGTSGQVYTASHLHLDAVNGINGGGLTDCSNPTTSKLLWSATTNLFSCGTDQGGGGGGTLTVMESDSSNSVSAVAEMEFGPTVSSSDQFIVSDQGSGIAKITLGNEVPLLNVSETVADGWTFSSAITANDGITTSSGTNLSLAANGSANIILGSDGDTGVYVGTSSNTPAALSVNGGIGSNALAIFNQNNSGDLLTASASGVTKFVIKNDGTASSSAGFTINNAGALQTTNGQTLTVGGAGTGNIVFDPNGSANGLTMISSGSTVSFSTGSSGGLTFNTGSGGINIGNNATAKAINIGGVTNDGSDTVSISTNATSPDDIYIGNANSGTEMSVTGGTAWSVGTSGNATFSSLTGAGLTACSSTQKLEWSSGTFSCGTDASTDSVSVDTITTSGTWNLPSDTKFAQVIVTGGGGGGGEATGTDTSNDNAAGGGGAGGTSIKMLSASTLGSSQTVTIGTGGVGGTGGNGNTGSTGNNSSFGTLVTANGGSGGPGAKGAASVTGAAVAAADTKLVPVQLPAVPEKHTVQAAAAHRISVLTPAQTEEPAQTVLSLSCLMSQRVLTLPNGMRQNLM
jgi:Glycine-rich domain